MSIDEGNESSDKERPFEHWYRGEAARNGGVGELRVERAEMMNIAKFGHKTPGSGGSPTKRTSPLGFGEFGQGRRRAGSMDEKRESWIPDTAGMSKVIDESPLTDLEGDEYTTEGERSYPYPIRNGGANGLGIAVNSSGQNSSAHSRGPSGDGYAEETFVEEDTIMSTTPTGISSMPMRNGTAGTEKATGIPSYGRQQSNGSGKVPLGANNGAGPAPSQSTSSGSIPKPGPKGKAKPRSRQVSKVSPPPAQDENVDEEEGYEMVAGEKIPFRRPPAKGNWDDIVLPAVSKKMGIEGYGLKSETGNILEINEEQRKRMSAIHPPVRTGLTLFLDCDADGWFRSLVYLATTHLNIDHHALKKTSIWRNWASRSLHPRARQRSLPPLPRRKKSPSGPAVNRRWRSRNIQPGRKTARLKRVGSRRLWSVRRARTSIGDRQRRRMNMPVVVVALLCDLPFDVVVVYDRFPFTGR